VPHLSLTRNPPGRLRLGLAITLVLLGLSVPPAHAATTLTTTRSCVDGGGVTWHTKVVWGSTYVAASGVRKVSIDYAGWTSTLGAIRTDSLVRTYDGSGRLQQRLDRTATVDYRQGTVYGARNPLNPRTGGARVVIKVGRDGDGFADCTVTHAQSATADPVVAAVGDMVCPPGTAVTAATCQQAAVSDSIVAARPDAFLTLGDNQYDDGTLAQFQGAYAPSYGRLKAITSPTAGNHEYNTPGAAGYFDYFGSAAGSRSLGYYSQDIGAWHVVTLNSERDISSTGAQLTWLKNDLAAHRNACTLAVLHKPRFSSGSHGSITAMTPFIDALVAARAELVLAGHDHHYERFAAQTGSGTLSSTGVTQVIVGTGGRSVYATRSVVPNSLARSSAGFGWLRLTLHRTSADLRFVPVAGSIFTDEETITCRS
jgi:hypothetical protein